MAFDEILQVVVDILIGEPIIPVGFLAIQAVRLLYPSGRFCGEWIRCPNKVEVQL